MSASNQPLPPPSETERQTHNVLSPKQQVYLSAISEVRQNEDMISKQAFKKAFVKEAFDIDLDDDGIAINPPVDNERSKMLTEAQYKKFVAFLENWELETMTDGSKGSKWRTKNRKGYWVKDKYSLKKMADGSSGLVTTRGNKSDIPDDPNPKERYVAHQMEVFDIIHSFHVDAGHSSSNTQVGLCIVLQHLTEDV